MTKGIICFLIIFLQSFAINAQSNLYDFITLGDYQVGFTDTIVFDTKYQYEAFDYVGMKPHFIQIWYPLEERVSNPDYVRFKDFYDWAETDRLSNIQKELKRSYKEAVTRDFIEQNVASGEANNFGKFSYADILNLIGETRTKSIMHNAFNASRFPVILYHHGAQSFPFENFVMAEYFASHGFIFVSASFHLPFENTIFGLKPFDKIIEDEEEQSLKSVLKFARTLTNAKSVFFIGHSWGAQMGLRTFDNDTTIKALISLETTIEFKTDQDKIKEMWPEVFQKVITEKARYPFPILFCAATGQAEPFAFFENINASSVVFCSTKNEFEHNAYVSSFYLRMLIDNSVNQPDMEILQDRLLLYSKHLELINEFIAEILEGETKSKSEVKFVKEE
ncbi:MAG: alpha/beta hydrolase [Chitinophagales bacterium]|nr:alpha/beta hydrolase [Chitinophagales bacterium]